MGGHFKRVLRAGAFGLAVFLWAGGALPAGAASGQPRVVVFPQSYNFGTVNEGDKAKAVFRIKNTGDVDLIIYDVRPSCGCTVANLSSKKLKPGETATLEAVYNSVNANGTIYKNVVVNTNDPGARTINLPITGTVKAVPQPDIMLSLFNVTNLQLPAGGKATRDVKITDTGQTDLVINEITTSPGMKATLDDRIIGEGQTVKMALTIKPGASKVMGITVMPRNIKGNFQEIVTIRSNSRRRPAVTFIAQGVVQG